MSPSGGDGTAGVPEHWFQPIAAFLGPAYLRYSFTRGTDQEVDHLVAELGLEPGMQVLDAGCGPGRHSLALARRGIEAHGIDLSPEFVELAAEAAAVEELPARFEVRDVRTLDASGDYDVVLCLCQGGFGLLGGDDDEAAFVRLAAALRPGGHLALTAFSLPFMVRHLEDHESLELTTGVLHERTELRDEAGNVRDAELWTTGFTPRELRLLAERSGLDVESVHGVAPGRYASDAPTLDDPELLLVARRPRS